VTAVLELEDVARHFPVRDALGRARGAVRAVDGVSLSVAKGSVLAIVGESGCGKSTLGRLALRLIEPDSGAVRFLGEDLGSLSARALRARRRSSSRTGWSRMTRRACRRIEAGRIFAGS
jgi:ABC-type oligopeptide transport system ATPase subunit